MSCQICTDKPLAVRAHGVRPFFLPPSPPPSSHILTDPHQWMAAISSVLLIALASYFILTKAALDKPDDFTSSKALLYIDIVLIALGHLVLLIWYWMAGKAGSFLMY